MPPRASSRLGALVEEIAAGAVDTLVVTAENPAYGAPVDFKLGQLLKRVPNVIYHGLYEDETAQSCNYLDPGRPPARVVGRWARHRRRGVDRSAAHRAALGREDRGRGASRRSSATASSERMTLLRKYWSSMSKLPGNLAGSFDGVWERWLADGIVPDTGASSEQGLAINGQALAQAAAPLLARQAAETGQAGLELGFAPDPKVFDGRFANNAWLQELAHPITKLTWDNVAMLSQATADRLSASRPATSWRSARAIGSWRRRR